MFFTLLIGAGAVSCAGGPTDAPPGPDDDVFRMLVVSSTPDYRHKSIPAGNRALKELGQQISSMPSVEKAEVDIVDTEGKYAETEPKTVPSDPSVLARYDVLVFNNSNDDTSPNGTETLVLDEDQQAAFKKYVQGGGGVVGIHSAIDNQTAGSFFSNVMGTYYEQHAEVQPGTIHVPDRVHPSTKHLPVSWDLTSEWYTFQTNPRGDVHVLTVADERTYDGKGMQGEGHLHPVSWCHRVAGGRSWYTALGHLPSQFRDEGFRNHLLGGITWAAGLVPGDAGGTVWDRYRRVPLDQDTKSPTMLEIAPDGRVFYVDRLDYRNDDSDQVRVIHPDTGETETVLDLPVSDERLNGLKGMKLDPDFEENGWIYLFYAPHDDEVDEDINVLSRFRMSDGTIDRDTEVRILEVPILRDIRGHIGGDMAWGPDGRMLYLSVGDNTDCCRTGYAPIDEREGEEHVDAQRTSANTADLRGSILRIIPREDGSYDVPAGNLFTEKRGYGEEIENGTVRPEIYAMGMRNPYRIGVDAKTGALYWGDYGPDAGAWDISFGPPGVVEFNRTTEPGFFGWPYFTGANVPYREFDFETEASGDLFNSKNPKNISRNNEGRTELPPARGAMIMSPRSWNQYLKAVPDRWKKHVPYASQREVPFPQVTGGAPMQGPIYRHRTGYGENALSRYYEGKIFIMERGQNWIKYVTMNDAGEPVTVEPFLPGTIFYRPMDMEVGPEGALYVAEWGSGYDGPNSDSGIYRIEYSARTRPGPAAETTPSREDGRVRDRPSPSAGGEQTRTTETGEGAERKADQTVVIKAGDTLRYDTEQFTVRPGSRVNLTFVHTGKRTVRAMGHNVVILNDPEADPVTFAREALRSGGRLKNDYLPDAVRESVLAATPLIGGGNSTSVVFKAPKKPKDYPFLCSFPQHAVSMNGVMKVRSKPDGKKEQ